MLRPAARRFASALAIALVGAGIVGVSPAGATPKTALTWTAIASWQTEGATASNVSLQVTRTESPGGASPVVFFFVSQQFCDVAHDQEVFRSFNGSQPAHDALFEVGPHLTVAVLGARQVPMSGSEQRFDGCTGDSLRAGRRARPASLGSFKASFFGNWLATGPKEIVGPGIKARDAIATGFQVSHGKLDLGDLGTAQFAQLRRTSVPIP